MVDRTVKVNLIAQVNGYLTGMAKAAAATKAAGTEAEKLAQKKEALGTLGRSLLTVGTLAAVGVGLAIKSFADFDAKMSQVQTLSHATGAEMDKLTDSALKLGQGIGFTAEQTADAEIELVKAGVSVKDIIGGALPGALQLAAAGQIDVGQATEIATIALTQFKLEGKDVPHVADLLAAGADKALGSVGDLGEALKSGGLVASQFGISLDETVGTLSAFANAGLIGETAGTDLRQLLLKLADPSKEAADEIKTLGLNIYDASGKFVGINSLSNQLYGSLSKQSEATRNAALSTIFGSRAIAGANVLYEQGSGSGNGIAKWTANVNDSGFAAQQAAGKMDNLQGDAKKLAAAFQTDLIKSGSSLNDVLRNIVQGVTFLIGAIGDVPQPVLAAGLVITGLVAAVGLVGGTALLAVPKFAAMKTALQTLEISAKTTATAVGLVGAGVALATVVIGAFITAQADQKALADEFANSLDKATGAVTHYTRAVAAKSLQDKGAFDQAKASGVSQKELTDAVFEGGKAYDDVAKKLNVLGSHSDDLNNKNHAQSESQVSVAKALKETRDALKAGEESYANTTAATEKNSGSTKAAAEAYQSAADEAKSLTDQIQKLTDQVNAANGVGQDAVTKNADYQKALADVSDAIKTNKHTVDESTAAGSANVAMLADLAKRSEDAASAQLSLDGNTDEYQKTLAAGHQAVYDNAIALGATADQAQAIADKVAAIPDQKTVQVLADTAQAATALDKFIKQYALNTIDIQPIVRSPQSSRVNANGGIYAYANGGVGEGIYSGGTPLYKFAEPETGFESFISGRPSARARNISLWQDTGRMLGVSGAASSGSQPVRVVVSSKGGIDLLKYIDVQIQSDQSDFASTLMGGSTS